ncbi:MAG: DISARM system helicase DrmA, partial [Thermodesulfobacteriota bacterium]
FYRASRPRDLSHYEFFCRHHRQLHRFVEAPTVYPFAPGSMERALGPLGVYVLRNMKSPANFWSMDNSALDMGRQSGNPEVVNLPAMMEKRANAQPHTRRPELKEVEREMKSKLEKWEATANTEADLEYWEKSGRVQHPIVLGDAAHQHTEITVVYRNAPQSLRDIEETTGFET